MDENQFTTPANRSQYDARLLRATGTKRDSLAAELERDPQLSTAKRQQRSQVLTTSMAYAHLERQLLASQTSKLELETKLREKDLLIERLERDRRWFADREKEEKDEKELERLEHEDEKKRIEGDLRTSRTSLSTLREELADLQDSHSALARNTSQTIASQKSQITTLTHRTSLLEEELEQVKQIASERSRAVQELQDQYDDVHANQSSLIRKTEEEENMGVVREELHRQANYLRTLESTNSKLTAELAILRDRHASIEVLKEEKRGLERKIMVLEELREKVVKLEAEVEAGRQERLEWASKIGENSPPSATPVSITQSLSDLRLAHARLLEEHGATTALLRRREAEVVNSERRETETRSMVDALEADVRTWKEHVSRDETKLTLLQREIGFLHALVASFNAEEAAQDGVLLDEIKIQRIQQLETLLEEYKTTNQQLSQEINALGGDSTSLGHGQSREVLLAEIEKDRLEKLNIEKALENVEAEVKERDTRIEVLEQTLFELGGEIGGGRHIPPNVRVLSLKDNPEQEWFDLRQAAMDRLKGENEALLKRLRDLENSGASTGQHQGESEELVPRESWELLQKEKQDLEDLVKEKEKRLLRLQQIFNLKGAEFRETIAAILGVKLAFYPNGQVRVTSLYDLCASFIFQPTSKSQGAKLQLVAQGDGGPQDLPDLMQFWIQNEQCIPGFMASVTLECYDKSKREGVDTEAKVN